MRAEDIRELTDDEIETRDRGARGRAFPSSHSRRDRRLWKIRFGCARSARMSHG